MIAFDLAEHVEHTTDVDGMLARMTPGQFEEWCVRDQIMPIGCHTKMVSHIAWMLANYFSEESIEPEVMMPWLHFEGIDKPQNAKAQQILKSVLGGQ
tara:strand:+ start:294 stop:584 length:291 start_codon:yes stop_codon:yes gene_type:complete